MIKDLIALDNSSRVWIYPSSEEFSHDELEMIRPEIFNFMDQWTSHNRTLVSYGNIFHKRFLALFVDESIAGASGCSIDSSVHFVKHIGSKYNKDFFNRQEVYVLENEEVVKYQLKDLKSLNETGKINRDTLFFDNLVNTKEAFIKSWVKPIGEGWLNRFL
jgi:hypothetical protein